MITSTDNKLVKWIGSLQRKRKVRAEEGLFVIEGTRWAEEALAAEAPIRLAMFSEILGDRGCQVIEAWRAQDVEIIEVSDSVLRACSDTQHPAGVLAVLPQPSLTTPDQSNMTLVVDQMSDPGNLGTLIRTAHAANVERLLLTTGSVDPFNPKVVRGAMGSLLHLPIEQLDVEKLAEALVGTDIWIADPAVGVRYDQVDWRLPSSLVVGGEAHGVTPEVAQLSQRHTHIPTATGTESLNAAIAAAVLLFEVLRQRNTGQ